MIHSWWVLAKVIFELLRLGGFVTHPERELEAAKESNMSRYLVSWREVISYCSWQPSPLLNLVYSFWNVFNLPFVWMVLECGWGMLVLHPWTPAHAPWQSTGQMLLRVHELESHITGWYYNTVNPSIAAMMQSGEFILLYILSLNYGPDHILSGWM